MTEKGTFPESVSSVLKVFNILHVLSENKKCSAADLSPRLMMSKAKTIHFLETMISLGYVVKDGEEYALTLKLFELGSKPLEYIDLEELADKEMVYISEVTGEAIHLGVLEGDSFVHTHKIDAQYNLITHSDIGRPRPLYSTAIGKMLLSGLDDKAVSALLKNVKLIKYTPNTMDCIDKLLVALDAIRKQHYSESMEEQEPGIRCLAAPIYDLMGNVIAGLSISTPTIRYDERRKAEYIELLHGACARISAQLGFHKYPVTVKHPVEILEAV